MLAQLQQRLQALKSEFEAGNQMLTDIQKKESDLKETLIRISGAIQVLEEEIEQASHVDQLDIMRIDESPVIDHED